jgi:hypothetical protein
MIIGRVVCQLCNRGFKSITHSHLKKEHGITLIEYIKMFPDFPIHEETIPKTSESELLLDGIMNAFDKGKI